MRTKPILIVLFILLSAYAAFSQTTEFTFQGSLKDGANPANGNYDFEFALFNALSGGTQVGTTITRSAVTVVAGSFAVKLDFGGQFPGANRFLDIHVRPSAGGAFTPLTPRQIVDSAPYSAKSLNSDNASNATQLGGISANGFIQNTTASQAGANFNITGNGTAGGTLSGNAINSATQYNIGGARVFSIAGTNNVFAGANTGTANTGTYNAFFGATAGQQNTTGDSNSFFGANAGKSNTIGTNNAFFGRNTGSSNTTASNNAYFGGGAGFSDGTASDNSFFGALAGAVNTTGAENSFFGKSAGQANESASSNAFFGANAGLGNTTGSSNSFVGTRAGQTNAEGSLNSFFGTSAGNFNTSGSNNSFFGVVAGQHNTTGDSNTLIGYQADVGSNNLTHATAIGAQAIVSTSNSIVLGRPDGSDTVFVIGVLRTGLDGSGSLDVCRNANFRLSTCSSSLRYKTNVQTYPGGLNIVRSLRPITFNWKDGGMSDVGFAAEEVNAVEPLLTTHNETGEIEGVKYKQITTVLVNAVKEQQAQIESLQQQVKEQRAEIDAFKSLVCSQNPSADVCRP